MATSDVHREGKKPSTKSAVPALKIVRPPNVRSSMASPGRVKSPKPMESRSSLPPGRLVSTCSGPQRTTRSRHGSPTNSPYTTPRDALVRSANSPYATPRDALVHSVNSVSQSNITPTGIAADRKSHSSSARCHQPHLASESSSTRGAVANADGLLCSTTTTTTTGATDATSHSTAASVPIQFPDLESFKWSAVSPCIDPLPVEKTSVALAATPVVGQLRSLRHSGSSAEQLPGGQPTGTLEERVAALERQSGVAPLRAQFERLVKLVQQQRQEFQALQTFVKHRLDLQGHPLDSELDSKASNGMHALGYFDGSRSERDVGNENFDVRHEKLETSSLIRKLEQCKIDAFEQLEEKNPSDPRSICFTDYTQQHRQVHITCDRALERLSNSTAYTSEAAPRPPVVISPPGPVSTPRLGGIHFQVVSDTNPPQDDANVLRALRGAFMLAHDSGKKNDAEALSLPRGTA